MMEAGEARGKDGRRSQLIARAGPRTGPPWHDSYRGCLVARAGPGEGPESTRCGTSTEAWRAKAMTDPREIAQFRWISGFG